MPDTCGESLPGKTEEGALLILRVVLDQYVGNADSLDAQIEPVIRDKLGNGRTEAARERMFFQGNQVVVVALEFEQQHFVEWLGKTGVDDGDAFVASASRAMSTVVP